MIIRFILHLVWIFVFLIGSTFSCAAIINENIWGDNHSMNESHTMTDHDCCPEDGHEKEWNIKNLIQIVNKQAFKIVYISLRNTNIWNPEENQYWSIRDIYQNPMYDRQSFFFTDTIRLLI